MWLDKIEYADWENLNEVNKIFRTADQLGNKSNRIIFNIGGNKYRLICNYHFGNKYVHLFINWIGTHSEYDKLCKSNMQYTINLY